MVLWLKFIVWIMLLAAPLRSAQAADGQVIVDLKPEVAEEDIDYLALYEEYKQELEYFDVRYPGSSINENFSDDVAELHPEYTDYQAQTKTGLIRTGVRAMRIYHSVMQAVQDFMLKNDIPLQFADNQYEMGEAVEYQPTDRPLIIKDFKKAVAYSNSPQDRLAVADKLARDAGELTPTERTKIIKQALLRKDWKTFFSYALYIGKIIEDERGEGLLSKTPELQAKLSAEVKTVAPGAKIRGVLQLYANPGWFLLSREYQNHPGLKIDFAPSANLRDISLNLPLPHRYFAGFQDSFVGYSGLCHIPFELEVANPAEPLRLQAEVVASLCNDKSGCRQVKVNPELELQPGSQPEPSLWAPALRMLSQIAPQPQSQELQLRHLWVEKLNPPTLRLEIATRHTPTAIEAFVEGEGAEEFAPPLVRIDGKKSIVRFVAKDTQAKLEGRQFQIAVGISPDIAVRQTLTAASAPLTDVESGHLSLGILLLAFWGGLLLNIMPCVFPVLALKIMSFTEFGALNMAKIRRAFTANLWGILAAFAVLIGGLISLKLLGYALGWGMQFQSLGFLSVMVFVIAGFIAHLWGWITIPSPRFCQDMLQRARSEFALQFLTGAFLVLLSSSCSAPCLGTALGLALAGTPLQIAIVVGCVGLGLAFPYILFALFPPLAYYMPRPGKWLRLVKALMFVMLFATLLWLLALLAVQCGSRIWWQFGLLLVGFWLALFFRRRLMDKLEEQEQDERIYQLLRRIFNLIIGALLVSLIFWSTHIAKSSDTGWKSARNTTISSRQIEAYLQQKQNVLLRVGADWCLTCSYNNFAAFSDPEVQKLLDKLGFVIIDVDWTDYNPDVLAYMQKFGRSGLPFYVIFTPRIPEGMVLPEVLNDQDLRSWLNNLQL